MPKANGTGIIEKKKAPPTLFVTRSTADTIKQERLHATKTKIISLLTDKAAKNTEKKISPANTNNKNNQAVNVDNIVHCPSGEAVELWLASVDIGVIR